MNNKGFTLVELLAVVVILTGVSLVAVASISSSLNKRGRKECEEQMELAKNAAKIYFALHPGVSTSSSVKVIDLKNGGYFNETSKTNRLTDNDYVYIQKNGTQYNKYRFMGQGDCKE